MDPRCLRAHPGLNQSLQFRLLQPLACDLISPNRSFLSPPVCRCARMPAHPQPLLPGALPLSPSARPPAPWPWRARLSAFGPAPGARLAPSRRVRADRLARRRSFFLSWPLVIPSARVQAGLRAVCSFSVCAFEGDFISPLHLAETKLQIEVIFPQRRGGGVLRRVLPSVAVETSAESVTPLRAIRVFFLGME